MAKIKLFEDVSPRKIIVSFKKIPDISDFKSSLRGKILQIKELTNLKRQVIINFDLEGKIIDIELGAEYLDTNVKILERSFDGRFYVYSENCKNLELSKKEVYRYYDYYNESIREDLNMSKFLVNSVNSLLKNLFKGDYKLDKKIKIKIDSPLAWEILESASKKYNWEGLLKEKQLIKEIYPTPVSVLPPEVRPDENPIFAVIQIVQGCWIQDLRGACKFCNSYRNVAYKEKNLKELREHIERVKKFTGGGWRYVKKIFFADADPFHTDLDSEIYLKFLRQGAPNISWYECFISTPTILSKSENKWKKLMKLGLRRLYWGVESTDDKTLKILGKPHNKKMLYQATSILNKIGLRYVVILLSGIGNLNLNGKKRDLTNNSHIIETAKFIQGINCSDVYISRFIPQPGTEIYTLIKKKKLDFLPLSEREIEHRTMVKMTSCDKKNPLIPVRNVRGTYGAQFNR
ncbi:radical SAM protein [Patescibacteria group bacterium]|nr:radical SAM protein [Patescibacteria group bacterium]